MLLLVIINSVPIPSVAHTQSYSSIRGIIFSSDPSAVRSPTIRYKKIDHSNGKQVRSFCPSVYNHCCSCTDKCGYIQESSLLKYVKC
jgi:hypothetical protein